MLNRLSETGILKENFKTWRPVVKYTEEQIYLKIVQLIENKGPNFTTAELAQHLKVSKRTIYELFSNKATMLDQTIDFIFMNVAASDVAILAQKKIPNNEILNQYINNFPHTYDVDKFLQHGDEIARRYPKQWARIELKLDEIGANLYAILVNNLEVRKLSTTEQQLVLLIIQQTSRQLLQVNYLKEHKLEFKSALQSLYKIILQGILK